MGLSCTTLDHTCERIVDPGIENCKVTSYMINPVNPQPLQAMLDKSIEQGCYAQRLSCDSAPRLKSSC
jgi:hypothetical protein